MVFDRVKRVVAEQLGLDVEEISMHSAFVDDLGADSLDIVELVMELEEEFDIEMSDEDAENFVTISDVVEYINERV